MSTLKISLFGTMLLASTLSIAKPLDSIAVVVNDDVLTQQELDERVAYVKNQYKTNPQILPADDVLRKQIAEALILESLQMQMAKRANIVIPEQLIDSTLATVAKNQKLTVTEFLQQLEATGQRSAAIREQIRKDLSIQEVQKQLIGKQIYVSDAEIDRYLLTQLGQSLKDTEYQLSYMRFELDQKEQAEQLLAKVNSGSLLLDEPDSRDLGARKLEDIPSIFRTLVPVLNDQEAVLIERNGALHLAQLTSKSETQSVNIDEYRMRHILIKTDVVFDDSAAKSLLTDIKSQLDQGASFADLADQYSEDEGTKGLGGLLDWSTLDAYVTEFANMARSTPIDQVSDIFKTPYGYHILTVEGTRKRDVGVDILRNQIRNQLAQKLYTESIQRWKAELLAESFVEYRE